MMTFSKRNLAVLAVAAGATLGLTACGSDGGSGGSGDGKRIALLLPESKAIRYESQDRPRFIAEVKKRCPDCKVIAANADQDASKQQQQIESAITQGADVIVMGAVNAASAASSVKRAQAAKIPIVAYDRMITNAHVDYYVSFDNERVGQLQAESIIKKLGPDAAKGKSIVMINGAPTDNNAKLFKNGAHKIIDSSGLRVAKEYDASDWSPDKAQNSMEQAITALGKNQIAAVYSANDGMAGGVIAAMKAAGINPSTRPVTGQDAEVAGVQRILKGEQYMTVYKAIKQEASAAAELAVALAQGKKPPAGLINGKVNNGVRDVPSVLLTPVAVTKDNVKDTIFKDGFLKRSEVCTSQFAKTCAQLKL